MAAIKFDFTVEAGAGYRADFVQADADGAPIPFAVGTTAELQARVTPRATGSPLLTLTGIAGTPDLGTVIVDAVGGKISLHMTDAGTRPFDLPTVDTVAYAVEVYEPGNDTRRFVEGRISCSPEVVRP